MVLGGVSLEKWAVTAFGGETTFIQRLEAISLIFSLISNFSLISLRIFLRFKAFFLWKTTFILRFKAFFFVKDNFFFYDSKHFFVKDNFYPDIWVNPILKALACEVSDRL